MPSKVSKHIAAPVSVEIQQQEPRVQPKKPAASGAVVAPTNGDLSADTRDTNAAPGKSTAAQYQDSDRSRSSSPHGDASRPRSLVPSETSSTTPPSTNLDPNKSIRVRGAREHNLKNIDVDIPRDKLVVITGLSGSGKSSLAFDTVFAEGQRKYMESLSAYARQFLDQLKKPDVDDIQGLPPTIAIEQRSSGNSPRSTVATSTEIYDYLRLLFARCGRPICWFPTKVKKDGTVAERCGLTISATASTQVVDSVMTIAANQRIMVLAPVIRSQKGFHRETLVDLQKQGWGRVRADGKVLELREVLKDEGENPLKFDRYAKHSVDAVIDRLTVSAAEGVRQRLAESIEAGLKLADGTVLVSIEQESSAKGGTPSWYDRVYSTKHACTEHPQCALEELSPRLFSFNSLHGACPTCHGLGAVMEFGEEMMIPDPGKSLAEGAIKAWRVPPPMGKVFRRRLKDFCKNFRVSPVTPYAMLSDKLKRILLNGATASDEKEFGAKFIGVGPSLRSWYDKTESAFMREWLGQFMTEKTCPACLGDRLRIEALSVMLKSKAKLTPGAMLVASPAASSSPSAGPVPSLSLNIARLCQLNIREAVEFMEGLELTKEQATIAEPILKEILSRLKFLSSVGLEYLSLDRKTATLSGGEAQRIRLATQVGSGLVGACYVLDEPTIGLHQRDNDRLIATLRRLTDIGNSVLVVEHDEDMIRQADWVIDVGPGPGVHGGRIVAQGRIPDIIARSKEGSVTGQYLSGEKRIDVPAQRRPVSASKAVVIKGATQNNLKKIDITIPLGGLVCVTGVSGSGKSTLVNDILLESLKKHFGQRSKPGGHDKITGLKHIDRVVEVDQSPIGRTPRSNPATYTGVFDEIRKVFTETKESKIRGYKPGRFSFNVKAKSGGGRCEACEGQGLKRIEMHFLPDVYVDCEICGGSRYNRETLEVKFRGKSIADVLDMTIEEAVGFFENHPKILRHVLCLHDVGLDYIKLGQPSTQLSGGEAQRVKLATELAAGTSLDGLSTDNHRTRGDTQSEIMARRAAGSPDAGKISTSDADTHADLDHLNGAAGSVSNGDSDDPPVRRAVMLARRNSLSSHALYVLDEPTTGLHFEDIRKLIGVLNRLADAGNSLVVIEHNLDVIKCADYLIDLGPEGGDNGGQVIATGTPEQVTKVKGSFTGQYLAGMLKQH